MSLQPGDKLGPYSVTRILGRGGMGEVWRARDERLDRDVAIKLLPAELTSKGDLAARFEREAKLLASLNHHNIAGVYGLEEADGASFIVMECVEGESLAARLNRGRVLPSDALEITRQVAEGLDAAHEKGIIHRDLKPGNIQVTEGNEAKVLDFGLARAAAESRDVEASSDSWMTSFSQSGSGTSASEPDVSTSPGTLLGTVPYMSPEQARGQTVDRRTDIWAFGCVLYECLAGRRPFTGETHADVLNAILSQEPDWSLLHAETPPTIALLLRRCLAKDRRKRLQDIGDARVELEHAIADPSSSALGLAAAALPAERPRWKAAVPWALAAVLALSWIATSLRDPGVEQEAVTPPAPKPVTRFHIDSPRGTRKGFLAAQSAISPDGRTVIMTGNESGNAFAVQLFRRSFDGLEFELLPGVEAGLQPSFSPDGKHLLFTGQRGLFRMALNGGSPEMIHPGMVFSPCWGDDDSIVFTVSLGQQPGLYRIAAAGGSAELLVAVDPKASEEALMAPHFLPGSQTLLFGVRYTEKANKPSQLHALDLKSGERKRLLEASPGATWIPPGFLVYQRGDKLLSQRMDPDTLELSGDPIRLVDKLTLDLFFGLSSFRLSRDGTLIYDSENIAPSVPTWITQAGKREVVSENLEPAIYQAFNPSPDGRYFASVTRHATDDIRLGIVDARRGTVRYITKGASFIWQPLWSPAAPDTIVYSAGAGVSGMDIYRAAIDGRSEPELLLRAETRDFASFWSRDGKTIVFDSYSDNGCDIRLLHLEDPPRVEDWRATKSRELLARLSPDGKWMAFVARDSGRNEVYVRAYPGQGRDFQVSISGGTYPTWSEDQKRIFFRDTKSVNKVYEVSFAAGAEPELGRPKLIFDQDTPSQRTGWLQPDGGRLMLMDPDESDDSIEVTVVLNLTEELKRRHAAQESR